MSAVTYSRKPRAKAPVFRVIYLDSSGRLGPRDTTGTVQDALPFDAPKTLEYAQEYARWIVDGTAWSVVAHVQERAFDGRTWKTVYTYSDL